MRNEKAKAVALGGVLFALAIALSLMEGAIAPLLGLMPGVKIGLANIVVMYALLYLSKRQALVLVLLKALFSLVFFGVTAGFLSACGGLFSLCVMAAVYKFGATHFIMSTCGALAHNMGQLAGASIILSSALALTYMPVLLVSGLVMGGITAGSMKVLLPALKNVGFTKNDC